MFRLFRSWRTLRWLAFLVSFAIDGYVFYVADPLTPRSFLASGLGALLLFFVFFEISISLRGKGRIRRALDEDERIEYEVGQHLLALLRTIGQHPGAARAIWGSLLLALAVTALISWALYLHIAGSSGQTPWPILAQYFCAGYLPLLLAIPFIIEHVSEWTSHRYVLVVDAKTRDPRLLIHYGVFDYDLETVAIERTVTTHVHQAWWEAMIGYGDVELRETAGGSGEKLMSVWLPRRLERKIRGAIKKSRRGRDGD